jgi:hypothetical protein
VEAFMDQLEVGNCNTIVVYSVNLVTTRSTFNCRTVICCNVFYCIYCNKRCVHNLLLS